MAADHGQHIIVSPWWHKVVYGIIGLVFGAFLYLVLSSLTTRINHAEEIANANEGAVSALSNQVRSLGATPVATPQSVARGATGATGASGQAGPEGPAGPSGVPGLNGAAGAAGATGSPGAAGADGESVKGDTGATGATGPAGKDGADGATGAQGPKGDPGPTCPDGYTSREQTFITPSSPTGENVLVCVADDQGTGSTNG